ncbi:LOW QUALITY PROTEIN: hypothetical protein SETIT_6G129600v2 [Setaria italica]|uniref:Uncharacterized protein n=1 Tax=Setaria italica TaxID=4555 RepID=A0A368RKY0_SETIT|nr:LOW QUALITY PROTEIN: hypothetical protein SETIT_6G129600v2 [Setaria italica]
MGDPHAVDIESLARQLREELAAAEAPPAQLASGCPIIIAQVGELTRNRNVDPARLHRDDEKLRSLGALLSAASAGMTLEVYRDELARLEGQARSCYAHTFEQIVSAEFVRMLLLDACYVLVRFGCVARRRRNGGGEAPSVGGDMMEAVAVVRRTRYRSSSSTRSTGSPFRTPAFPRRRLSRGTSGSSCAAGVLGGHAGGSGAAGDMQPSAPDAYRTLATHHRQQSHRRQASVRPVAHGDGVPLRWRGIPDPAPWRLAAKAAPARSSTLTWRLLRNLIALEQSNPAAAGSHVTAYCVLVSQLACTPRDVEVLSRRGVIVHGLGSHGEVAELFAGLCNGVAFGADDPCGNYLHATWQAMEGRFWSRPRRWAAWLMLRYFTNPWLAVGLLCTVVLAVYSVLSYTQGAT